MSHITHFLDMTQSMKMLQVLVMRFLLLALTGQLIYHVHVQMGLGVESVVNLAVLHHLHQVEVVISVVTITLGLVVVVYQQVVGHMVILIVLVIQYTILQDRYVRLELEVIYIVVFQLHKTVQLGLLKLLTVTFTKQIQLVQLVANRLGLVLRLLLHKVICLLVQQHRHNHQEVEVEMIKETLEKHNQNQNILKR